MKNILNSLQNIQKRVISSWKRGLILGIGVLVLGLAVWSLVDIWVEYHLPAQEIVQEAIDQTLNCESYQFEARAVREIAEERSNICAIKGVVNGEDIHLSGCVDVVAGEFEIYQLGDTYYRRDSADGKWLMVDNMGKEATQILLAELSPLDFLKFSAPYEVEYLGKEIIGEEKCRKFQILNYVNTSYMTYDWQEVLLTVWIDKHGYVTQAEILATEADEPQKKLELVIDFALFKKVEAISAPLL